MAAKKIGVKVDAVIVELVKVAREMGSQSAATATVSDLRKKWATHIVEVAIMAGNAATWVAATKDIERRIKSNVDGLAVDMRAPKSKKDAKSTAVVYNMPTIWRVAKETINKAFAYKVPFTVTDEETGKVTQQSFSKIREHAKLASRVDDIADKAKEDPTEAKRMELADAMGQLAARYRRLKPEYIQQAIDAAHAMFKAAENMVMVGNVGKAAEAVKAAEPVAPTKARSRKAATDKAAAGLSATG